MTKGKVTSIISNLITIDVDGPVAQNEICILVFGEKRLKAEVIRVNGNTAYAQVFESTRGIKTGMEMEFSGKMLEIELGPGILSKNFDGLQNDLDKMEGTFLVTGEEADPLDGEAIYTFTPLMKQGQQVKAGDWLGTVMENWIEHKIMVPFSLQGSFTIKSIVESGDYKIHDTIAVLISKSGNEIPVSMVQKWPVKIAIPNYKRKIRPFDILQTGLRVIDTFNPLTEGGTGFVPGAFGTGKTVLQQAIAKNGEADIIIIVGCGERANEVVDIFTEFPNLTDPRTGRKLQERTTIVCNTSNMPVATREASVYVGMTIAEYYRNMGYKVLVLADSTSRWAQSLREISNRLEELPGPDAYPVELPATIANFYSRAGYVELNNGKTGSVTFIGTISPAGGNFKEPVTESTRKVASCFYALSQKRADAKRYPAIDPVASYSKYLEYDEFKTFTDENIELGWTKYVKKALDIIKLGIEARDYIRILGDDAVPIEYHVRFWRRETFDFAFIQQDSFDEIDMNSPLERQKYMLHKILNICEIDFEFENFQETGEFFKKIINLLRQMNFVELESQQFKEYEEKLQQMVEDHKTKEVLEV